MPDPAPHSIETVRWTKAMEPPGEQTEGDSPFQSCLACGVGRQRVCRPAAARNPKGDRATVGELPTRSCQTSHCRTTGADREHGHESQRGA